MGLGDFLSQLAREAVTDAVSDAAERRLADHANRRQPGAAPPTSVQNSRTGKIIAAACAAVFVPFFTLVVLGILVNAPEKAAAAPLFGGIAVWMSLACYDGFVRRIEWDDKQVRFRNWNRDRLVAWSDIIALEKKSYPPIWRVGFRDGTGFGVSETMQGSRYFLSRIERRLTPASLRNWKGGKRRKRRQRSKKR